MHGGGIMDNFFVAYTPEFYKNNTYDLTSGLEFPRLSDGFDGFDEFGDVSISNTKEIPSSDSKWYDSWLEVSPKNITISENPVLKDSYISFENMLKKTGLDKYIKITSGYRDPSRKVGKYYKTSNHGKKNEHGDPYAYDIVPIVGTIEEMKQRLRNNPEMQQYLLKNEFRKLEETTKNALAQTGGTDPHLHLSYRPGSTEGVAWAAKGMKFEWASIPFSSNEVKKEIYVPDFTTKFEYEYPEFSVPKKLPENTVVNNISEPWYSGYVEKEYTPIETSFKEGEVNTATKIYDFFKSKGLKDHHIAGIMGNLDIESGGFNHKALGDSGSAYGLAQWRGDRLTNLKNKQGYDTLEGQLNYIWDELNGSEKNAYIALLNAKDSDEATKVFMDKYERPKKDPKINHIDRRINSAKKYLKG